MRSFEGLKYKMPLSLEDHFLHLRENYSQVEELYSLWGLLKKRMIEELSNSRGVFSTYSFHDASHSRTIIQTIERFLGDERIGQLSATDTFMLLVCAYAHDYGMSQSISRIYEILGSEDFEAFLAEMNKKKHTLEDEDNWAIEQLLKHMNDEKEKVPLKDLYYAIVLVIQAYLRPMHWRGVVDIENDFKGLFQGHLKGRFVSGAEGIIAICMCHGQDIKSLDKLSIRADGIIGDEFHPRFIAAMLRLGDLLDLDNSRFPMWFVRENQKDDSIIPKLSVLNYHKHEAISHFLVTPKCIEITAECDSEQYGYEVAKLVSDWTSWLLADCKQLVLHWNDIVQPDFGRPPSNVKVEILVDGRPYMSENRDLQMKMSQENVMELLEGINIYRDRYIGIREMIQNAVDASLLQMWQDILQNRYSANGLSKNDANADMDVMDFLKDNRAAIFGNYDIKVELIKDIANKRVYLIIKDKGIGILPEDIEYISELGSGKEKNKHLKELMDKMPAWLKPSGVFGIGLQSVFQLTDCIHFYTRQPNSPEKQISLYSYGKNRGKIEVREVPEPDDGIYYDNAVPGTNVKIAIEPRKLMKGNLQYYDLNFDDDDSLNVVFSEMAQACLENIREERGEYFNISFQTMTCEGEEDANPVKEPPRKLKRSFFYYSKQTRNEKGRFGTGLETLFKQSKDKRHLPPYSFIYNKAFYWDKDSKRFYLWTLRPCEIKNNGNGDQPTQQIYLPETAPNLYKVLYKFNRISNIETIYSKYSRDTQGHAGFLSLTILILDDKPAKYLNIDRDRLKESALIEEELIGTRNKIVVEWCRYFCEIDERSLGIKFESNPQILMSLILLFYEQVPESDFNQFIDKYKDKIDLENLVLGDEKIPISTLWTPNQMFETKVGIDIKLPRSTRKNSRRNTVQINESTARHLPHTLINIKSISYNNNLLTYRFNIKNETQVNEAIDMDEGAMLYDFLGVFDGYVSEKQRNKLNYYSIQKKLFKPNSRYKSLVLTQYPHTFRRGENLSSSMDYCIRRYILSPFDKQATEILSSILKKDTEGGGEVFRKYVLNDSPQFQKCVNYILKQRYAGEEDKYRDIIIGEYEHLVDDFYRLLSEYKRNQ